MTRSRATTGVETRGCVAWPCASAWVAENAKPAVAMRMPNRVPNERRADAIRYLDFSTSESGKRVERPVAHDQRRVVDGNVSGHAAAQKLQRAGAHAREPVKLELQEHPSRRLLRRGRQALTDDAQNPAIAIVLDACDCLQRLARRRQRVIPAPEQRE